MLILKFIIFLSITLGIYLGMHYLVYASFIKGFNFSVKTKWYLGIFLLLSALSYLLGRMLIGRMPVYPVVWYGSIWMGFIAIAFSVFLLKEIIRIFVKKRERALSLGAVVLTVVLTGYSLFNASGLPVVKSMDISLKKDMPGDSPFKIIQLSDLHLGITSSEKWLEGVVDIVNAKEPDLIVITGDLVDSNLNDQERYCRLLGKLSARYGVYAVTGNHEYYVGLDKFHAIAEKSGITVLRNEKAEVAGIIELAGIDDLGRGRRQDGAKKALRVLEICDTDKVVVLLSHRPWIFDAALALGADLQLSGHLHAGQSPPMDMIIFTFFDYPYGLYEKGGAFLYETSGTGTWGPPMRLFSRSEIVEINLTGSSLVNN